MRTVVLSGQAAPGTPAGVVYGGFAEPVLNAAGQTAFSAELTGNGVDDSNNEGIWATDSGGVPQLIARTGDLLEVAPADFRTIWRIDFVNIFGEGSGNGDGRPSGFNDLGQLAFSATFTDGSSGVFVSDLVAHPGGQDGDFDLDGDTDGADFLLWQRGEAPGGLSAAGLTAWKNDFGASAAPTQSPVPEPAPLLLALLAAAAIRLRKQ